MSSDDVHSEEEAVHNFLHGTGGGGTAINHEAGVWKMEDV